jgi:hypothetical protein
VSGAVPPLPHTLSWCAQEQVCLYIYRSVINISGLFYISELLFVEVVKIKHRAKNKQISGTEIRAKTPVQSVPLWDTADSAAGGTRGVVCFYVQFACCALYADRCCVLVWFTTVWRFVPCRSDPRTLPSTDTVNTGRPAAAPSSEANRFNPLNADLNPICHLLALL